MFLSAQAAITKYHRLGGLNTRSALSHSTGGWKSEMKMSAGSVASETSLGLQMGFFSLYLHMVFPLGILCILLSSYKDFSHILLGLTLTTSF